MAQVSCNAVVKRGRVQYLPVTLIRPNPAQPRRNFDVAALAELTESIRRYGVIQPLTVRKQDGGYELVAGERRLRAARLAGHKKVPCILSEIATEDSAIVALIENIQRQDLNFFEEATAFEALIRQHNLTQEAAASVLSLSQSAVANKLRLLRLPEELRLLILSSGLSERHARALLKLPDEQAQSEVLQEVITRHMSVAETERYIERYLEGRQEKPKRTLLFKDVRVFINTINHAISVMRQSGIDAISQKNETDTFIEYSIRIPKSAGA